MARQACDAFCTALSVVRRAWMVRGGVLDLAWMQRQLITENNIACTLYLLDDIGGAVHFMNSAICSLNDIEDRFGTSKWLREQDSGLQRLLIALSKRRLEGADLPCFDI